MDEFKFDKENDVIVDFNQGSPYEFDRDNIKEDDVLLSYENNGIQRHILRVDPELIMWDRFKLVTQIKSLNTSNPEITEDNGKIYAFLDGVRLVRWSENDHRPFNRYSYFDKRDGNFLEECTEFESCMKEWIIVWGNKIGNNIAWHYSNCRGDRKCNRIPPLEEFIFECLKEKLVEAYQFEAQSSIESIAECDLPCSKNKSKEY